MVHYNNAIYVPDTDGLKPYWKSHLGLKEDAIVVSMIANITPFKDHKTLFKAWSSVENHFKVKQKDVFLLLAGRPEDKVVQELKILGFDLHISNSIRFLGGTNKTNE
jgi:glycosyltransferase involved in cell wall biosynthesis